MDTTQTPAEDFDALRTQDLAAIAAADPGSAPAQATPAQRAELAQTIATQAQALADGTVIGPEYAAWRRVLANVQTLVAWTPDDRSR
jgi:hypothetical protein